MGSVSGVFPLLFLFFSVFLMSLSSSYGSLVVSTCISLTTSILVLDGGLQCFCCRSKPLCPSFRLFGQDSFDYISDKALIKMFSIFSRLGILMGFVTIITECMTFWDTKVSSFFLLFFVHIVLVLIVLVVM